MREIRKALAYALAFTAAFAATMTSASAACSVAGTWHVFLMQGQSPSIKMATVGVGAVDNNGATFVRVFPVLPNNGQPFDNHTALAIQCKLTLSTIGEFAGDKCDIRGVAPGDNARRTVNGRLVFGSGTEICSITGGTINVSGDPDGVVIIGGHVNGNNGAGVARQRSNSVFLFNMVKQ